MCVCVCNSWLSYPTCIAHVPYYTVTVACSGLQHFSTLAYKRHGPPPKRKIGHKICKHNLHTLR